MGQMYYYIVVGTDACGEYSGDYDYDPLRNSNNDVILYSTIEAAKDAMKTQIDVHRKIGAETCDEVHDIEIEDEGITFSVGCRYNVHVYLEAASICY